jgi:hypothetical protein
VASLRTISMVWRLHSRTSRMHSRGHVCTEYVACFFGRDTPEADAGSFQATDDITNTRDFQNAHCYETHFNRVFTAGSSESQTVINNREFAAFYHLLRCFDEDVSTVANNTSSSLKASNFTVHFVQSPFLSGIYNDSRGFRYRQ